MFGRFLFQALSLGLVSADIINQFSSPKKLVGSSFGIPGINATFDYVIVGGGIAGSVVATRLLQNTNATVALVEAGSFYELTNGNWSQIPYWSYEWVGGGQDDWQPLVDWGLFTEPQVNNQRIHYAQGRNLGGSSGRNQMMYHRPTKGAYQAWAEHVGDESYTWEHMEKYLERSMQFSPNLAKRPVNETPTYENGTYSPSGGPLHVSYPGWVWPLSQYALQAFSSIGMEQINNFASGVLNGYGWWQWTIDPSTGLRSSAQNTFLTESFRKPEFTAYINSHANNIIFENTTAIGVNVTNYGQRPFILKARKEIIVAAGAYHSPQLLMVSGIGPKDTLMEYNISVVSDLPGVGQNMWDSCNVGGPVYEVSLPGYTAWQQPDLMAEAVHMLLHNGSGPLSATGIDIGAWEKLPRSNLSHDTVHELASFPADWPELEYAFSTSGKTLDSADATKQYASIGCVLVAATSRGNMTINSASNLDPPVINPNWLMSKTDQQVAIAAYKRAREAWKAVPVRVGAEIFPGTNVTTDDQILAALIRNLTPIHHASASCAMGKADNPQAVVDPKGRVYGVQALRVVDSSSFPFTPPGHTQGVTYAHAEKLVDDILEAYRDAGC